MNSELSTALPGNTDDAFWAALFAQEQSINLPPRELPAEEWSSLSPEPPKDNHTSAKPAESTPWPAIQNSYEADEALELTVIGCNKGGLLVYCHGLQGFIPASQLIDFPHFHLEAERIRTLKSMVGRTLTLKIIEVSPEKNRLILSERTAQIEADDRERLFRKLAPGSVVEGSITNLTDFGVFVDLGGIEGLVHISELSWSRVDHPSRFVQPGQIVVAQVLQVDRENGRVALSVKRLKEDPWVNVESRYQPGQLITAPISNIVKYGAFVQVEEDLEGLIHISELAEGAFLHPRNVVNLGDMVTARILHVDGKSKRLALSLRGVSR